MSMLGYSVGSEYAVIFILPEMWNILFVACTN